MLNSALVTEMRKTSTDILIKKPPWLFNEDKNVLIERKIRGR